MPGPKKDVKKKVRFSKSVWWAVDADYLDKLGPEDRANYMKFLAEFYDGDVSAADPGAIHQGNVRCTYCAGLGFRALKAPRRCGPCSEKASKKCALCQGTGQIVRLPCNDCSAVGTVLARRDCYKRKNAANRDQYTRDRRDQGKDIKDYADLPKGRPKG